MESIELSAEGREQTGSRVSRRLRREGRLPVNLYGEGGDPIALHLDTRHFGDALRRRARIVKLQMAGGAESAVIKDVQHDPVSQALVHADLIRVDLSRKVEVKVPLRLRGPAVGQAKGGILVETHDEVAVRCLPLNIPADIEVDVRPLGIHDSIHVRDLVIPPEEDLEVVDDPDLILISITEPRFGVEEETPAEEGGEAEPEVIGKGDKQGEEPAES